MPHRVWDPSAGCPASPEQLPPRSATIGDREGRTFAQGVECGTRVAACVARASALELLARARWWNRWRYRLMASALVACAEELELWAEEDEAARRGLAETRKPGSPEEAGLSVN